MLLISFISYVQLCDSTWDMEISLVLTFISYFISQFAGKRYYFCLITKINFKKNWITFLALTELVEQAKSKTGLVIIFSPQFTNLHVILTFPWVLVTIFVFYYNKIKYFKS